MTNPVSQSGAQIAAPARAGLPFKKFGPNADKKIAEYEGKLTDVVDALQKKMEDVFAMRVHYTKPGSHASVANYKVLTSTIKQYKNVKGFKEAAIHTGKVLKTYHAAVSNKMAKLERDVGEAVHEGIRYGFNGIGALLGRIAKPLEDLTRAIGEVVASVMGFIARGVMMIAHGILQIAPYIVAAAIATGVIAGLTAALIASPLTVGFVVLTGLVIGQYVLRHFDKKEQTRLTEYVAQNQAPVEQKEVMDAKTFERKVQELANSELTALQDLADLTALKDLKAVAGKEAALVAEQSELKSSTELDALLVKPKAVANAKPKVVAKPQRNFVFRAGRAILSHIPGLNRLVS